MGTREGGIVLTLKNGNRVEIKLMAWPCRSFFRDSAAHHRSVHHAFRNMNGATQKPLQNSSNLTLPALLNKVPATERTLIKILS
jgi:hypothetical protein